MIKNKIFLWGMVVMMGVGSFSCSTQSMESESIKESKSINKEDSIKEKKEYLYPIIKKEEYPKIDGSTATLPLSYALYRMATGVDEETAIGDIVHSKTTESYIRLLQGENDIILAYAPSQELMEAIQNAPSTYEYYGDTIDTVPLKLEPLGRDALVFLTNINNPVESLTEEEIIEIYSGKIKNWKELGGKDIEIKAFQRVENSGSQNLMEKLVMKEVPMKDTEKEFRLGDMGELIENVALYDNDSNALGYSVYYYAKNMKTDDGLKFIEVGDIPPSTDTIRSGEYPYINPFYVAIREDEPKDSNTYKLFDFLTSSNGQALVNYLGYVANEESDKELYTAIQERLEAK